MLEAHKTYASEYDKISDNFYSGNAVQSAKKIFKFLKENIKYTVDSEANQRIMSPSAIISVGKNDCKNYWKVPKLAHRRWWHFMDFCRRNSN